MKKLLFFLFGLLVLASCKKKDDAQPQTPAQVVAGQYNLTTYSDGKQTVNLPFTANGQTLSGTVLLAAVAGQDAKVDITITVKVTGQTDQSQTETGVLVQAASSGYNLVSGTQQIGTADGTNLTLVDGSDKFTAKR